MSADCVDLSVRSERNPLRDPRDRRLKRIAGPSSLVLFGVTGDLARKKIVPAVYDLASRGLLPPSFALVGFGRRDWGHADFAAEAKKSVMACSRTSFDEAVWEQLSEGIRFVRGEFDDDQAFKQLSATLDGLDEQRGYAGQSRALSLNCTEGLRTGLSPAFRPRAGAR
jgi:glucose-6-phosphate 1-dehydrogenase